MSSGILRTWNDERGFGFIAPTQGGRELFVHISAFAQDGSRPTVGETLHFDLGTGQDGKPQALRVRRLALAAGTGRDRELEAPLPGEAAQRLERKAAVGRHAGVGAALASPPALSGGSTFWRALVFVVLMASLGAYGYKHYRQSLSELQRISAAPPGAGQNTEPAPALAPSSESFRCDGRTHCSQMRSCAEASYFLRHCPGVQMDGDQDGVACEEQHCGKG